jgi:hypothetical protein
MSELTSHPFGTVEEQKTGPYENGNEDESFQVRGLASKLHIHTDSVTFYHIPEHANTSHRNVASAGACPCNWRVQGNDKNDNLSYFSSPTSIFKPLILFKCKYRERERLH